ncbi:MAG: sensor domain-containing diguanylate cyclase, partial [Thermodesulfobacteriota bacterium]
ISFVFDVNPQAKGLKLAKTERIEVLKSINEIKETGVDLVINLTGSIEAGSELKKVIGTEIELMGGVSAGLLKSIIDERRKRLEDRERSKKEREVFLNMGIHMEKIDNMKDASFAIVDYATGLTDMPSGALSILDEEAGEMSLAASTGLKGFAPDLRWRVEDCAATVSIMKNDGQKPVNVDSFEQEQFPGLHFKELGVTSITAAPLILDQKIYAILYLCDFNDRVFLREDLELLSLFSVYSALIIDKVKTLDKMRHLIVTDGLTGLVNQRHLMESLDREFQRSKRYGHDLSIIMFEIDHFKAYTDEFGHVQGNELLRHLSKLLRESVRTTDVVARFGVDKFCILICEVGKEGAFTFAQRLVERIASYPMPNKKITVSAGVTSYPRDVQSYMELISKSEGNLHRAKEWGRNRACN